MSTKHESGELTLAQARYEKARAWILLHPEMSKRQTVQLLGVSDSTVARARRDLVDEGLIPRARNAPPPRLPQLPLPPPVGPAPVSLATAVPEEAPPRPAPAKLTDHAGMKKIAAAQAAIDAEAYAELAAMIDEAIDTGDHEAIQKKLLKQCLMFAMRPDLHPDTRMSASQMYNKLRDMAKAKDLGPGKPKNFEAGVSRLAELHAACGPEMVLAAVHRAFTVKEEPNGEAPSNNPAQAAGPAQAVGPTVAAPAPPEAPGPTVHDAPGDANPW